MYIRARWSTLVGFLSMQTTISTVYIKGTALIIEKSCISRLNIITQCLARSFYCHQTPTVLTNKCRPKNKTGKRGQAQLISRIHVAKSSIQSARGNIAAASID